MTFHHIFSGPPGQTPELVARDVESAQGVRDAIRQQLRMGPSAVRVVTSDMKFEQAWNTFRDQAPLDDEDASLDEGPAPAYPDVLGTWAEVTDEFIKD